MMFGKRRQWPGQLSQHALPAPSQAFPLPGRAFLPSCPPDLSGAWAIFPGLVQHLSSLASLCVLILIILLPLIG